MPRVSPAIPMIVALLVTACNDAPNPAPQCAPTSEVTPLVDNALWAPLDADKDPLAEHRPESVACPEDALIFEGTSSPVLEIDTGRCNYVSLVQTMPVAIQPCDTIQAVITHEALFAPEPAVAHAAIIMGDQIVWEQEFPIPSFGSELLIPTFTIPQGLPAGSPVIFHLHNHGVNTWNLLSVAITPAQ